MVASEITCSEACSKHVNFKRIVILTITIAMISSLFLPAVNSQQSKVQASISETAYVVREDSVSLPVSVSYSYSTKQTLQITVSTCNPVQDYEKTAQVGPGTSLTKVDFILKPIPSTDSWTLTISLHSTNPNGVTIDLLGEKEVNMDLKAAGQPSWGGVLFVLGAIALGVGLFFTRKR